MGKFLLIFCVVWLLTFMQGLLTKRTGTEILMKDFIDALSQQHDNEYSKRYIHTTVSEEVTNVGDDGAKGALLNGIRSFVKVKRLRHTDLGIVKRSNHGMDDLHSRGVNNTEPDVVIRPIPQLPILTTTTAKATTTTATSAAAATSSAAIPLPIIKWPKIDFCKWLFFVCKRNGKKGWLFSR